MDPTILRDRVIDGKYAARLVRRSLKTRVKTLRALGVVPKLAFVRVGDDPASAVYVRGKERACRWVGIASEHIHVPETVSADELLSIVDRLNQDPEVDGILLQLPLPDHLPREVLNSVDPAKDVDGFHPFNLGLLMAGRGVLEPCTPAGILRMLRMMHVPVAGLQSVVVGRSIIVGRPANAMMLRANATAVCCHRHTRDLEGHIRRSDIVIVATGVPRLIPGAWIKKGAYVFDVGITRMEDGSLVGDVCFDEVLELGRAAGITPVPGGVGPMTVAMLLENTVKATTLRRGILLDS